jgi:hypothetical protein
MGEFTGSLIDLTCSNLDIIHLQYALYSRDDVWPITVMIDRLRRANMLI